VEFPTTRTRPHATVVDAASYQVEAGRTLAVVGESGSGKNLTARAALGVLPPGARVTSGTVRLHGIDLLALTPRQMRSIRGRHLSLVFQDALAALNPVLPVGQQIAEVYRVHERTGRREAARRAVEMLDRVRIPDAARRARQHPHQFSGGMRQRDMIAMALALTPQVVIADEPTTALDVTVQGQILDLLRELQDENHLSLVLVSHDLAVVAQTADHVAVMYAGQIVEQAPASALYIRPAHPCTQALMDAVPRRGRRGLPLTALPGSPRRHSANHRLPLPATLPARPRGMRRRSPRSHTRQRAHQLLPPLAGGDRRMTVVLEVRDLVKRHSPARAISMRRQTRMVTAVDGVSLSLREGETLGLVGESGCGKSTPARMLTAVDRPTSGEITVLGTRLDLLRGRALRAARRDIQLIFQDPYTCLDPRMTAGEIVREPLVIHRGLTPRGNHHSRVGDSWSWSDSAPITPDADPTSSPAVSDNASASPGHWRYGPRSWSATNPSPPSTSPYRPRS
jgi:ABC-type glutathione transport system ATPase component